MLNSVYLTLFQGRLSFLVASSTASSKEAEQYDYAKSGGLQFNFAEKIECGSVVYDTLTSPGYPNDYPPNMDCNYSVPIPLDMAMKLFFHEFDMEYDSKCEKWKDYCHYVEYYTLIKQSSIFYVEYITDQARGLYGHNINLAVLTA